MWKDDRHIAKRWFIFLKTLILSSPEAAEYNISKGTKSSNEIKKESYGLEYNIKDFLIAI